MTAYLPHIGVALLLAAVVGRVDACSCSADTAAEKTKIERELKSARVVVIARLVSVKQTPVRDAPGHLTEYAAFVVSQVLKGDVVAGRTIRVQSQLGPGSCGRSAQNDPVWLEEIDAPSEPPKAAAISKEWLIYGYGTEPYELSLCDRSMPLNVGGAKDLEYLRKLVD